MHGRGRVFLLPPVEGGGGAFGTPRGKHSHGMCSKVPHLVVDRKCMAHTIDEIDKGPHAFLAKGGEYSNSMWDYHTILTK